MESINKNSRDNNRETKPKPPTRKRIRRGLQTLTWHSNDYAEMFVYISANKYSFNWKIIHDGNLLKRDFGIASSSQPGAILEQQAATVARNWIRANLSEDMRIRIRSATERAALFSAQQEVTWGRRAA